MTEPLTLSAETVRRIREFRKTRRISGEQLAEGLTKQGFPMTRSVLSNYENGRFRTVPVDFLDAAMRFFGVSYNHFFHGPLCSSCDDDPPVQYICKVCQRTRNSDGELTRC